MASGTINYDNALQLIPKSTRDILVDALNVSNFGWFIGSGSSYSGNIPNANYGHGIFVVFNRLGDKNVIGFNGTYGIIINRYNGSSWTGWKTVSVS